MEIERPLLHDEIAAWLGDSRYAVLPWLKEALLRRGASALLGAASGGAARSIS